MLDILIRNGLIADGTGKAAVRADVAVKDGKIVRIAPDISLEAKTVVYASGNGRFPRALSTTTPMATPIALFGTRCLQPAGAGGYHRDRR